MKNQIFNTFDALEKGFLESASTKHQYELIENLFSQFGWDKSLFEEKDFQVVYILFKNEHRVIGCYTPLEIFFGLWGKEGFVNKSQVGIFSQGKFYLNHKQTSQHEFFAALLELMRL